MQIAMWSGPRNLSTAMMYSFAARSDTWVWDEPFYAAYLTLTGQNHPMRDEIIAAGETDPLRVIMACTGPAPDGSAVHFQKHMLQHLVPQVPRGWIAEVKNFILIRHPARVIASYDAKRERPDPADLGYAQAVEVMAQLRSAGQTPLIVDTTELRAAPQPFLKAICHSLDLPFDPAMLSWPKGPHPNDGVWAPHWYNAVWQSTGFSPERRELPQLRAELAPTLEACLPQYETLAALRLCL